MVYPPASAATVNYLAPRWHNLTSDNAMISSARRPHSTFLYSITSSARTSSDGATASPSALATFRLITSSNFVGCSTGRSAGLVPLRICRALTRTIRHRHNVGTSSLTADDTCRQRDNARRLNIGERVAKVDDHADGRCKQARGGFLRAWRGSLQVPSSRDPSYCHLVAIDFGRGQVPQDRRHPQI